MPDVISLGLWTPTVYTEERLAQGMSTILGHLGFDISEDPEVRGPQWHNYDFRRYGDRARKWHTDSIIGYDPGEWPMWEVVWATHSPTKFRGFKARPYELVAFRRTVKHKAVWKRPDRWFLRTWTHDLPENLTPASREGSFTT